MKRILIITEDIIKIQTLSGFLGNLFKTVYLTWLSFRLQLTVLLLKPFFEVNVITADVFKLKHSSVYYYGDVLAKLDYSQHRSRHLKITDRLLKNIQPNLFKNRLAIFLTYDYFIYAQLYETLILQIKPDIAVSISQSFHEQIAHFIAKKNHIKILKLHWLTFIYLNHWLKRFFQQRQYRQKINQFLAQATTTPPPLKKLKQADLLSLDFFRHLKTLAPLYNALAQKNLHPWLVTDTTNPDTILNNINLPSANYFFLASFLPKDFITQPPVLPKKLTGINNLSDFLYNLSLEAAKPMIKHCQTLSQLYLAAADNLFKKIKPHSAIVVSDARFCELALSLTSKNKKVPSLLVSPNTLLALDKLNGYDTTDQIAVVGQFVKNQLISIGLSSKKIHVIGDLRTENYQQIVSQLNPQLTFKKLGLTPKQKIALLISFPATSMIPQPEKKAFFKLAAAIATTQNVKLVVKPHPSEKRYRLLEEIRQWGITNVVVADNTQLELNDLLNVCSVVLQTWSMTIFEAIKMNKPVISINPFNKNYGFFLPILKTDAAVKVTSERQLKKWLPILIDPDNLRTQKQLLKANQICFQYIQPSTKKSAADKLIELL